MGASLGGIQGFVSSALSSLTTQRQASLRKGASYTLVRMRVVLPPAAAPLVLYLILLLALPVGLLVLYSLWTADFFAVEPIFTLENYARIVTDALFLPLILKTFGIAYLTAAIITVLGFVMAYAITFRFPIWGPRILVMIMATLLSSYIVRLYALTTILGTNGIMNQVLMALGLTDRPLGFLLYGYFAIVITLAYVYLPIAVLPMYAGLQGIDRRLLEASRDLGASPLSTFVRVTLPLATPSVRIAFAFSFILTSADYIAPRMVGGLNGQMVGAVIADQFGGASNYPMGAALSIAMVIGFAAIIGLTSLLGGVASWLAHRCLRPSARRRPTRCPNAVQHLFGFVAGWPWVEAMTILTLLFLFAPLLTVVVFSFNTTRNPGLPLEGLTLHWYVEVLERPEFWRILKTSLTIAGVTVLGGIVIGVPAAFALARRNFSLRHFLNLLVYGPMAMPGVVIGVALLTTFIFVDIRLGIETTQAAHILLVLPFIVLIVRARLDKLDRRLEEAGRDLGASPRRVFRTITLPLIASSLLGAGILAAAVSMDELLVTNFTIGAEATLPVWIASQMRSGLTPSINAIAVMTLLGSLLLIALAAAALHLRRTARLSTTLLEVQ
jgi:putative spermidine/putrescine transport system permease protein